MLRPEAFLKIVILIYINFNNIFEEIDDKLSKIKSGFIFVTNEHHMDYSSIYNFGCAF